MKIHNKVISTLLAFSISMAAVTGVLSERVNAESQTITYEDSSQISSWASSEIDRASKLGFVSGSNNKFNPRSNISRAEFTKIIASLLKLDREIPNAINFSDVKKSDWFYSYVNAAYKAGIITGNGDKFNPKNEIKREEMAAIIVRALNIEHRNTNIEIKDIEKVSSWAKADVKTVVDLGLIVGSNGNFNPKSNATKEMATVVAMRGYDHKGNPPVEDNENPTDGHLNVESKIKNTAKYMENTVTNPLVGSVGGEWNILGLARSNTKVADSYYEKYYKNLEKTLIEKDGKLHRVKYTEYSRVILALSSIGKDIKNVAGYDLTVPLADFDTLIKQGINGPIFALIAFDSKNYEIPIIEEFKTQTTRDILIDYILNREIAGGGWALAESASIADSDITGMAIQSLTPYYDRPQVKQAVDRAISHLSKIQESNGAYSNGSSVNLESTAQVILALSGMGIDPHNDKRFIKNGNSAIEGLLDFSITSGGFYHIKANGTDTGGAKPGQADGMATEQGMYAMVAYDRFTKDQNRLYDMTDVKH